MSNQKFIHLRVHSSYSIGMSSLAIKDIVYEDIDAVAITDLNNMFGVREFSIKTLEKGIKPIIGLEVTVSLKKGNHSFFGNLVLLAKNEEGYKNLLKIHSNLYLKSEDKLAVTLEDILLNSKNLVCLSGGNKGFLGRIILHKNDELTEETINSLKNSFKDNFYIEINRAIDDENLDLEDEFLAVAEKYNLPIVATNDVYFLNSRGYEANDVVVCIGSGTNLDDKDRFRNSGEQYFKSEEQMVELFKDLPEALENTIEIAKKCNFFVDRLPPVMPYFADNSDEIIKEEARKGLEKRIEIETANNVIDGSEEAKKEYYERLDYELDIIVKTGFSGYFLIVSDFINWAKNNDVMVGPGRGSGAGSIVAWSLNITDINPIRFKLLFQRFLNPERISMPDFDIDFEPEGRAKVIDYVINKYGKDNVAQIITFGTLQTRAALRDVGRALGMPYIDVDRICKKIPQSSQTNPITISKALEDDEALNFEVKSNPMLNKLFSIALELEGLFRNTGTHAAGIVISKDPLYNIVPLYKAEEQNMPSAGFSMKYIEDTGLIKFDFLGLATLTTIKKALNFIKLLNNIDVDLNAIPLVDKKIGDMLKARSLGVFQLESRGMMEVLSQSNPERIEDMVAVIALYRPGPMENIPAYLERKQNKDKISYIHELARDILEETLGIIIYQEQVMQIAQKLAGYSLGSADILRRAMGKKKQEEMDEQRAIFVEGALKNNISRDIAEGIFEQIAKFAGYGFNKSHAACYGVVSWQTAYLKTYYTAEFLAASMTYNLDDPNKILLFLEEAKFFNIKVAAPNINNPYKDFTPFIDEGGNKGIYYSILAIKGVGIKLVEEVFEEIQKGGNFKSVEDFLSRVPANVLNKRQLENLIKAGAFDSLEKNRQKLFHNLETLINYNTSVFNEKESNQINFFDMGEGNQKKEVLFLEDTKFYSEREKLTEEFNVLGLFFSNHPLDEYKDKISGDILTYNDVIENKPAKAKIACVVIKNKISKNRNQDKYSILTCSDNSGVFTLNLFGKKHQEINDKIYVGGIFIFNIMTKVEDDNIRLFIDSVSEFSANNLKKKEAPRNKFNVEITLEDFSRLAELKSAISEYENIKGEQSIYLNTNNGYFVLVKNTMVDDKLLNKLSNINMRYKKVD